MYKKMKQWVSVLLVAAMILTTMSLPIQASAKATYATRVQVMAQIVKSIGATGKSTAKQMKAVKDVKKSSSNYKTVSKALKAGIITPDAKGKVYPKKTATYGYTAELLEEATGTAKKAILGTTKPSKKITITQLKKLIRKTLSANDNNDENDDNNNNDEIVAAPVVKNTDDVAALEKLIAEQTSRGATISTDLDSYEYDWDENGYLISIAWDEKGLSGDISFSELSHLQRIICFDGELTSIDVSNNKALEYLYCGYNSLSSIDISQNTELIFLQCQNNQFTTLDLSKNTQILALLCDGNQLTELDLSQNTELTYLQCVNNQFTTLDLSKNTELTELGCSHLDYLDLSKNTALEYLGCLFNPISSLDLSNNTELYELDCAYSQITTLDLTKNIKLEKLFCDDTVTVIGYNGTYLSDLDYLW